MSDEKSLNSLSDRELIELFNKALERRDEISEYRKSGIRLASFVYYKDEPVIVELVGVADWRDVCKEDEQGFSDHFRSDLSQSGTCDNCGLEIVSYSKSAKCPACFRKVQCT